MVRHSGPEGRIKIRRKWLLMTEVKKPIYWVNFLQVHSSQRAEAIKLPVYFIVIWRSIRKRKAKEAYCGTTYDRAGGKDPEMGIYKKVRVWTHKNNGKFGVKASLTTSLRIITGRSCSHKEDGPGNWVVFDGRNQSENRSKSQAEEREAE